MYGAGRKPAQGAGHYNWQDLAVFTRLIKERGIGKFLPRALNHSLLIVISSSVNLHLPFVTFSPLVANSCESLKLLKINLNTSHNCIMHSLILNNVVDTIIFQRHHELICGEIITAPSSQVARQQLSNHRCRAPAMLNWAYQQYQHSAAPFLDMISSILSTMMVLDLFDVIIILIVSTPSPKIHRERRETPNRSDCSL